MPEDQPTLDSLAATISQAAQVITSYHDANGLFAPSFAEDSPFSYPQVPEIINARTQLIDATFDLHQLILGASDGIFLQPLFVGIPNNPNDHGNL